MADFARRLDTDYSIPPGETLAEILQERGMSKADLARRTARPLKTLLSYCGKAAATSSMSPPPPASLLGRAIDCVAAWATGGERRASR